MIKNKAALIVLDGWGISAHKKGNAILLAKTPTMNFLKKNYSYLELNASGKYVGLQAGDIGNSEVGHLHLGAGRLVKQDSTRISESIKNKSIFKNPVLVKAMQKAKKNTLHLLGLVSDGGVHSHISHLFALLEMAKQFKIKRLYIHAITDGRDVQPKSALNYLKQVEKHLQKNWKIATVIGRFYAMDRDNRWNREHKAYNAMANGKGHNHKNAKEAIIEAYKKRESDEFVFPTIIEKKGIVKNNDVIIFFNFRSDRARELTRAFVQGRFNKFKRKKILNLHFVCLTQYDPSIKTPVAFPPEKIKNTLGEVLAEQKYKQFRLAETEKWAHVTYFFNGLSGVVWKGEKRLLIPSPKQVRTYDKIPEMSAFKITKKAVEILESNKYKFLLVNYANPDMIGHTGNLKATIKAIEIIDSCIKKICEAVKKNNWALIITADHGNAEKMQYLDGSMNTAHTTNKVPCILISEKYKLKKIKNPSLYNIAPTIIKLMEIAKPKEWSESLVKNHNI
ncbi:2,3-bisphosphoglycerate-independent phosphoglycerate mutase [Candidatus Woesearchaeota archaeon]|nr:2,3-bisphosphoglycerate-independent phosphoglycerate mutase [Candidatus Woesearchaeota archaeon]